MSLYENSQRNNCPEVIHYSATKAKLKSCREWAVIIPGVLFGYFLHKQEVTKEHLANCRKFGLETLRETTL